MQLWARDVQNGMRGLSHVTYLRIIVRSHVFVALLYAKKPLFTDVSHWFSPTCTRYSQSSSLSVLLCSNRGSVTLCIVNFKSHPLWYLAPPLLCKIILVLCMHSWWRDDHCWPLAKASCIPQTIASHWRKGGINLWRRQRATFRCSNE